MVVHLVTSAKGKEEAYGNANNSARYENIEDARKMDDMALKAWESHPNRVIVGNETDFEVKMRKAIQAIFEYLGDEKPVEVFKKYLVEIDNDDMERVAQEADHSIVHIFQQYLVSTSGIERRIRKRERNGSVLYYYSEASIISTNERIKRDRILSERQYYDYQNEVDRSLSSIDKIRHSFIYDNHFCKLDIFNFDQSKGLLSIQVPENGEEVNLPSYLKVVKEVTDNNAYKNYYLAKSQKY